MLSFLFGIETKSKGPLDRVDFEKSISKIPPKKLIMECFIRLDEHITQCNATSDSLKRGMRLVVWFVIAMTLEKLNDIFHVVQHMPSLGG